MKNYLSKILFMSLLLCCPLCSTLYNSVQAHAGHEHLPDSATDKQTSKKGIKAQFRPYIDLRYEIVVDGEHVGHFFIKRTRRRNNSSAALRLEQTFHLSDKDIVDPKVTANYSPEAKTLRYHVSGEDNDYEIWVDLQDLTGGDNTGVRITYSKDPENRSVTVEDIIVRQVVEGNDHSGNHGDDNNTDHSDDNS